MQNFRKYYFKVFIYFNLELIYNIDSGPKFHKIDQERRFYSIIVVIMSFSKSLFFTLELRISLTFFDRQYKLEGAEAFSHVHQD